MGNNRRRKWTEGTNLTRNKNRIEKKKKRN